MGCSFTEGVGCWDMESLPKNFSVDGSVQYHREKIKTTPRFHEFGWANRLGKKLGYDKVINLGLGGSSTSGQAKWFFTQYLNKDLSEWDVLVVWLLSDPSRISFYKNTKIVNQMSNPINPENYAFDGYIKFISDSKTFKEDMVLEQLFYRNIIKTICEQKSYNFLTFNLYSPDHNHIFDRFNPNDKTYSPIHVDDAAGPEYISEICQHWNELGYEYVAKNMYDWINVKHNYLVNPNFDGEFSWEWDGDSARYNLKYEDLDKLI